MAKGKNYNAGDRKQVEAQKKVDKLQEIENGLKAQLMEAMKAAKSTSVGGKLALVTHRVKPKAVAKDWSLIQNYIKEFDAFEIMEARLSTKAILERVDNGAEPPPGMEWYDVDTLSVAKAKK